MKTFVVLSYDASHLICRVHQVHMMNVEQCQAATDSQTKPTNLGCESAYSGYKHHTLPHLSVQMSQLVRRLFLQHCSRFGHLAKCPS